MKGFPRGFYGLLISALLILSLSGIALIPHTLEERLMLNLDELNLFGWIRPMVIMHGVLAFLMTLFLGAVWVIHMRMWWNKRKHLWSGSMVAGLMAILILTGMGVHYLGDEEWVIRTTLTHTGLGLLMCFAILAHILVASQSQASAD
jgi:hypothetical protein